MFVYSEHINELMTPWTDPPSLGAGGWAFSRSPFQHYKPIPGPLCLLSLLIRNTHSSLHLHSLATWVCPHLQITSPWRLPATPSLSLRSRPQDLAVPASLVNLPPPSPPPVLQPHRTPHSRPILDLTTQNALRSSF